MSMSILSRTRAEATLSQRRASYAPASKLNRATDPLLCKQRRRPPERLDAAARAMAPVAARWDEWLAAIRAFQIKATETGGSIQRQAVELLDACERRLLAVLSQAEAGHLRESLRRLHAQ